MMILIAFTLVSLVSFSSIETGHDLHFSKCDIKYNTETASLQITLNLFIDDLENSLRQEGIDDLYILTRKESPEADRYISQYLNNKLQIKVNGQMVNYTFLGKEISDDLMAAWCYMEVYDVNDVRQLEVTNKILIELFDDQKNITTIKQDRDRKAYFLFDDRKTTERVEM